MSGLMRRNFRSLQGMSERRDRSSRLSILTRSFLISLTSALAIFAIADGRAASDRPDHLVILIEENHGYNEIVHSAEAPFINFLTTQGTLFTKYYAVSHPSEPNYLALFSGSTQGVHDDRVHVFNAPTLAGALQQAGLSFAGYAETGSPNSHNPWETFTESANFGRPFSQFPESFDSLPTVSFVVPNLDNDMHDGSVARGDRWLKDHLAGYVAWAKTHNSLLIVTFDEDDGQEGNHVLTVIVGDHVPAGQNSTPSSHLSLLRTIEDMYGLPPLAESISAPFMTFAPN
jgi:phosphatidylinositol-3-phosphatase